MKTLTSKNTVLLTLVSLVALCMFIFSTLVGIPTHFTLYRRQGKRAVVRTTIFFRRSMYTFGLAPTSFCPPHSQISWSEKGGRMRTFKFGRLDSFSQIGLVASGLIGYIKTSGRK